MREIRITAEVAVQLFNTWMTRLEERPDQRTAELGMIKLDTVPSINGAVHQMDGSIVRVYYKAAEEPTARAIREAAEATETLGLSRRVYTGRLIDIMRGKDGTVYFKVRTVERRDERHNNQPAFRAFNPSKGQLLEMVFNPHEHHDLNLTGR
jgi:hypothetical protein